MRRGVTLGADTLRGCAAAGAATALAAGAVTAAVAGAVTAAVAVAGAGVAAGAAGCWESAACDACAAAGAPATAGSLRSADESAARLGLERAASIPMATAKANTEREILQVIVWSMFSAPGQPRRFVEDETSPFCKLSPAKHRRAAA
jgi:hypothetical protein